VKVISVLRNRRLKRLDRQLDRAESYAEWMETACEHDEVSGMQRWREVDQTPLYDYNSIRRRLDRLRSLSARHDDVGLLFTLNEGIHGNMGGMGSSELHHQPRVISGSSAGSMVAGVLGTHSDSELEKFYDPKQVHFEAESEATALDRMFFGKNPSIDVHDLQNIVERLIPDMTFQEAYEKTGRQISISVAPAEPQQTSRLLNAIASPNVYIRSAVMASCAVPGVFPPVILSAKNVHGDPQPYLPSRKWVDGSISDDLPAKRLGRLYSTNHSIGSMVNPIALPFVQSGKQGNPLLAGVGKIGIELARAALNLYRSQVQPR
jgi:hypothetical protein